MSRALRFCMLTTFYPPYHFGGDAIGIQRLVRALAKRGHEVTVVHDEDAYLLLNGGVEPQPDSPEARITRIGLRTRSRFVTALLTQQFGRPIVNGRRIRKILDAGHFDVVNYHNVSLVGGPGLFAYGDAIKLYMAHEHWLVCPSHVLWRHGRERCDAKQCLRCVVRHKRPPQVWRYTGFLERMARHVDTFIAMSEFSRAKHEEFGFASDMTVMPYFLPDPEPGDAHVQGAFPHERPYFLFVGRLELIKGLEDVIPHFAHYEAADLLIAGDGDHTANLKALARDHGVLESRVKFLGRVDPEALRRYYHHALALIVPSVCFETFGIILIEAFRQGTPVIARRLGPFPEIVAKARAGELFETGDELLAAMERLQNDPERRAELAANALEAYREHWCESAVLPRYLAIVREAAERRGAQDVVAACSEEGVTQ